MVVLIPGCATSGLVNLWSEPSYSGPVLSNVLVVSDSRDPVKRRLWEDAFAGGLAMLKVSATPSYRLFPDAIPDSNQMPEIVAKNGFNGIIITRRLPKTVNANYVAPYVSTESETKYSRRRQEFKTYYHDVVHSGYVDSQTVYNRSIDVWTAGNESRLIWSAMSVTPEPIAPEDRNRSVVNLVIGDLKSKRIIVKVK
jgi:hypothetical protein